MTNRYEVHPSRNFDWMVVDTKTHHAVAFRNDKEEAQAVCDERNASRDLAKRKRDLIATMKGF